MEEYEWVKRETEFGESVRVSSSSILQINYLHPEDTGFYECVVKTDSGSLIGSSIFHLEIQENRNENGKNSLFFIFVDRYIKPGGRVEVLCVSGNFIYNIKAILQQKILNLIINSILYEKKNWELKNG